MYLRAALLLAALLTLLVAGEQAHGQKKGKGKKGNRFEGVITRITFGQGNEDARITVLHDEHKGKGKDNQVGRERTFDVDLNTKIDRYDASAKKGKKGKKARDKDPIRFTALKKGQHVVVQFRGNHAEEITLISGGGKGKGKGKDKKKSD